MISNRTEFLQRVKNTVLSVEPTAKVFLYGSRARGDWNEESDWDFLILTNQPKINYLIERSFRHPLYRIEWEVGEIISSVIYNSKEWEYKYSITPLYQNIKKDGIEL